MLDKAEEKAAFDKVLEHTTQEAAAQKAVADKALLDMGEMEVGAHVAGRIGGTIVPCKKRMQGGNGFWSGPCSTCHGMSTPGRLGWPAVSC